MIVSEWQQWGDRLLNKLTTLSQAKVAGRILAIDHVPIGPVEREGWVTAAKGFMVWLYLQMSQGLLTPECFSDNYSGCWTEFYTSFSSDPSSYLIVPGVQEAEDSTETKHKTTEAVQAEQESGKGVEAGNEKERENEREEEVDYNQVKQKKKKKKSIESV